MSNNRKPKAKNPDSASDRIAVAICDAIGSDLENMGDGIEKFQSLQLSSSSAVSDSTLMESSARSLDETSQGQEDWVDFDAEFVENTQTHANRFEYYLESGTESDLTLFVGAESKRVRVHKLILSIGSPVFRAMFNVDQNRNEFDIPDIEPEEFHLFLKFLYTGKPPVNVAEALPLLNTANKYKVPDLILSCCDLLKSTLTNESSIVLFQQACRFNNVYLQKAAMRHICRNAAKIVETLEFLDLTSENLIKILENDKLEVFDESQLFDAVMRWAKEHCKRQKVLATPKYIRSVLENIIHLIRFPQMNKLDLSLKVGPAQVLTNDEITSLFLYFQVPESIRSCIPPGVFNSKPRKYYVPYGEHHILRRLCIGSDSYYGWPMTTNSSTYYYIPMTHASHAIRIKVCTPIWITSFGINPPAVSQVTSDNQIHIKLKLTDCLEERVVGRNVCHYSSKNSVSEVEHLKFDKPIRMRANAWYIASFRILEGNYYGKVFKTADYGTVVEEDELGKTVTNRVGDDGREIMFEFVNVDASSSYTTVLQGYLPEIGYQIE